MMRGLRRLVCWATLTGGAAVCFAWLWPVRTNIEGAAMHLLNFAAFAIRTLPLHGVIACIMLIKLALILRMRWVILPLLAIAGFLAWPVWLDVRPKTIPQNIGPTLTIYSANLLFGRADPEILTRDIQRAHADLVLFQEYTPAASDALRRRLRSEYPYFIEAPATNASGRAIFSRVPFNSEDDPPPGTDHSTREMEVTIHLAGREVVVRNIHLMTPLRPSLIEIQSKQTRALTSQVRTETRPVLLAGDFNCTPASVHAGWLRDAGLIDSHRAAGEGIGATWSMTGLRRLITHVRIDHVYTGNALIPMSHRLGQPNGSDHRPVIAVVGFSSEHAPRP